MIPGWPKLNYMPRSDFKVLDVEMVKIWEHYQSSIENLRLQVPEFNSLYTDKKSQMKIIKNKKMELYANLYLIISMA